VIDIATRLATYCSRLDAAGLSRYAHSLSEAALPSVRLVADAQIDPATVGASRLGGSPDLPADLPWPVSDDGTPLSFIAQLDLEETAAHDAEGILPKTGLLSFFYEAARRNQAYQSGRRGLRACHDLIVAPLPPGNFRAGHSPALGQP
jgi:hypothetical protein